MKTLTRRVFLALSAVAVFNFPAFAQDVGTLHLTPLHIELPVTWQFNESKRPIEGSGPDGEKVLVSIMRKRIAASEPVPDAGDLAKGFAQGPMGQLATKGGKIIVRPIAEMPVPAGKAGYSVGSEASGVFAGKSYFVQYLLASPGVLIYLTFEGKGEALSAMKRFDSFFETQRWDE